jgi:L-fuconolactonase
MHEARWKPRVETTVEVFGANHYVMESNHPDDGRSCGFVPLWSAMNGRLSDEGWT